VPLLIDQEYGAIPPDAVQLAEYITPAVTGPVVGVHDTDSICPDAARGIQTNNAETSRTENQRMPPLGSISYLILARDGELHRRSRYQVRLAAI
jgi:hypothetical protein